KKHSAKEIKIGEAKKYDIETVPLYYENIFEFEAKVIKIEDGNKIILDKTAFFPRQGGQDCDIGYIDEYKVLDVVKIGKTIIHVLENKKISLKEGDLVK
ncbi:MAG: alanine--tRNA ligase-related protein, partial [Candidatus Aenigmatarchaeota archaeon]